MSEQFNSNVTFGRSSRGRTSSQQAIWNRYVNRGLGRLEQMLQAVTPDHCCDCDPQDCSPRIPMGACELHLREQM